MTSPYLERPLRTFEQAQRDILASRLRVRLAEQRCYVESLGRSPVLATKKPKQRHLVLAAITAATTALAAMGAHAIPAAPPLRAETLWRQHESPPRPVNPLDEAREEQRWMSDRLNTFRLQRHARELQLKERELRRSMDTTEEMLDEVERSLNQTRRQLQQLQREEERENR